jgi:hypothetical protein
MIFMLAGRLTDLSEKSTCPVGCHQSSLAKIGAGAPLSFLLSNVRKLNLQMRHSLSAANFAGIVCEPIRDRTICVLFYTTAAIIFNKFSADDAKGNRIECQGVFADGTEFCEPCGDLAGLIQWCFLFSEGLLALVVEWRSQKAIHQLMYKELQHGCCWNFVRRRS